MSCTVLSIQYLDKKKVAFRSNCAIWHKALNTTYFFLLLSLFSFLIFLYRPAPSLHQTQIFTALRPFWYKDKKQRGYLVNDHYYTAFGSKSQLGLLVIGGKRNPWSNENLPSNTLTYIHMYSYYVWGRNSWVACKWSKKRKGSFLNLLLSQFFVTL